MRNLVIGFILGLAVTSFASSSVDWRERYFKQGWLWGQISGMEEVTSVLMHSEDAKSAVLSMHPHNADDAWNEWKATFKNKKPMSWQMEDGQ